MRTHPTACRGLPYMVESWVICSRREVISATGIRRGCGGRMAYCKRQASRAGLDPPLPYRNSRRQTSESAYGLCDMAFDDCRRKRLDGNGGSRPALRQFNSRRQTSESAYGLCDTAFDDCRRKRLDCNGGSRPALRQLVLMACRQQQQIIGATATQRFHHARAMGFHRLDADAQHCRDFLAAHAATQLAQDLALTRR